MTNTSPASLSYLAFLLTYLSLPQGLSFPLGCDAACLSALLNCVCDMMTFARSVNMLQGTEASVLWLWTLLIM